MVSLKKYNSFCYDHNPAFTPKAVFLICTIKEILNYQFLKSCGIRIGEGQVEEQTPGRWMFNLRRQMIYLKFGSFEIV